MARVLVATQAWGVLWEKDADRKVKIPAQGQSASINTTVYAAATGTPTVAFTSNDNGELPGWVEEGSWTLTIDGTARQVEARSGTASSATVTTKTASHTLELADAEAIVEMDSGSAQVFTVPPNSSVAFPIGTTVELVRYGAGTVTITPGSGVTMPNTIEPAGTTSRTITGQMLSASLYKRATDEWVLSGSLA